jgi:hypothetical protein
MSNSFADYEALIARKQRWFNSSSYSISAAVWFIFDMMNVQANAMAIRNVIEITRPILIIRYHLLIMRMWPRATLFELNELAEEFALETEKSLVISDDFYVIFPRNCIFPPVSVYASEAVANLRDF